MSDYYELKGIQCEHSHICHWEYIDVPHDSGFGIRIYYKPDEREGYGFTFYAVEAIGIMADSDTWDEENYVECVYHGVAFWDGLRHLYMGHENTGNEGYDFYPKIKNHIAVLNALLPLEKRFCQEYQMETA